MENTQTITPAIYSALAKAQSEFATVAKSKVNPMFRSHYADLDSILNAVRPALNKHGLALTQKAGIAEGAVTVETVIYASDGSSVSSGILTMPIVPTKNDKVAMTQLVGSAITYAKRYSLAAFLGIAADEDDDGNAGLQAQQPSRPAPVTVDPAVEEAAVEAGKKGLEAYQGFFLTLDNKTRQVLVASGKHEQLKVIAKNSGAGHA